MKERKFQSQVKKQLESQAAFIINVHGHGMQMAGLPDLLVIHKNWKGWLELKVEKGKASAIQRIIAAKIELRRMPIYVLRCVENLVAEINFGGQHYKYQLENFQGEVIAEIEDLSSLLDILLVRLELDKWNEG